MFNYTEKSQNVLSGLKAKPYRPILDGRVKKATGLTIEAVGIDAPIGSLCNIKTEDGVVYEAEVIGFNDGVTFLIPITRVKSLTPMARVSHFGHQATIPITDEYIGRVIDANGRPIDGGSKFVNVEYVSVEPDEINPMARSPINKALDVGVASINAFTTVGQGQRMGLMAGSGVGKSVLLGMMTRFSSADIIVVGLIGERGREVKEFIDHVLGAEGRKKSVVVAAPADQSPLMRVRAAELSTRIAEHYRDKGKNVLLLMDSVTRYAQALREISLAIGELPVNKGYPTSVFAKLPSLIERAGNGLNGVGSITAFYTVLSEGDDLQDPIADAARAILDGHVVLSREIADRGQYPAVNIEGSVSRVFDAVASKKHNKMVKQLKRIYSIYREKEDMLNIAYQAGTNKELDAAIAMFPKITDFLTQGIDECRDLSGSIAEIEALFAQLLECLDESEEKTETA